MPGSNIVQWGAQSVRSVIFTGSLDDTRVDALYVTAFAQQPANYQAAQPGIPFAVSQASGLLSKVQATVQKAPGRVELILSPVAGYTIRVEKEPTFHLINDVHDAVDVAMRGVVHLLDNKEVAIGTIARLSLIVDLAKPLATIGEANAAIMEAIPYALNIDNTSDFILQINKKIAVKGFDDVLMNRICRWMVTQAQQFTVPATQFAIQSFPLQGMVSFHLAQVTMDFNTVPGNRAISPSEVGPVLLALSDEINNARQGKWG
jgi:hypothetical protein